MTSRFLPVVVQAKVMLGPNITTSVFFQTLKVENYMSSSACSTIFITILLACHVVCQNMNRLSSVQIILIMSQIYMKEKLFSDNYLYHFIA